jgi:hypothetical protein
VVIDVVEMEREARSVRQEGHADRIRTSGDRQRYNPFSSREGAFREKFLSGHAATIRPFIGNSF